MNKRKALKLKTENVYIREGGEERRQKPVRRLRPLEVETEETAAIKTKDRARSYIPLAKRREDDEKKSLFLRGGGRRRDPVMRRSKVTIYAINLSGREEMDGGAIVQMNRDRSSPDGEEECPSAKRGGGDENEVGRLSRQKKKIKRLSTP